MPLVNIDNRMRELGRIRTGDQSDKGAPRKLTSFRLTSSSKELLDRAGALYGGEVQPWKDAPNPGQYELYTEAESIPVIVPPGDTLSQWMEMWSGGGCQRRCDGAWDQLNDVACQCPADTDDRQAQAQAGKACKITTRLNVLLPELPDLGMWRLESHGYYAAVELSGVSMVLAAPSSSGAFSIYPRCQSPSPSSSRPSRRWRGRAREPSWRASSGTCRRRRPGSWTARPAELGTTEPSGGPGKSPSGKYIRSTLAAGIASGCGSMLSTQHGRRERSMTSAATSPIGPVAHGGSEGERRRL